ncbi:MAG TPA: CcdB family protein [Rhizomicrobium sp.]
MTISYFDLITNPVRHSRKAIPFYICVQHSLLDHLRTRIMAPLQPVGTHQPSRLYPHLNVAGQMVFLNPTDLVTMEARHLGQPIANLAADSFRIIAALDLVFTGV